LHLTDANGYEIVPKNGDQTVPATESNPSGVNNLGG
jgi:hypothetical protein